jgi:hypothetical protein
MLVCDKCGTLVEAHELPFVTEAHGEKHRNTVCGCGGEFVEATKCDVCGEWFDNRGLDGVCEVCLEEHETVEEALNFGDENEVEISGINGAVAFLLSAEQINKILKKWVEENFVDHSKDIIEYCEDDFCEFSEYLADKYGE